MSEKVFELWEAVIRLFKVREQAGRIQLKKHWNNQENPLKKLFVIKKIK